MSILNLFLLPRHRSLNKSIIRLLRLRLIVFLCFFLLIQRLTINNIAVIGDYTTMQNFIVCFLLSNIIYNVI